MKHTPGEWTVLKAPLAFEKEEGYGFYEISVPGKWIAKVISGTPETTQEEAESNAKLIAASPLLLQQLTIALKYIQSGELMDEGQINDIQKAIKIATYEI